MNLPDIPDYVAGYFNFAIDFMSNPRKACEPYKANNSVNKTLLTYAAIGIAFTWLVTRIIKKLAEHYHDNSGIFRFVENYDADTIPLIVLPAILLLSLLLHVAVKLVFLFNRKEYRNIIKAQVNFKNTFNGTLAFFAVAPFAFITLFACTMLLVYNIHLKAGQFVLLLIILLPFVILELAFLFWYFPVSVSAVQPDEISASYRKAIISLYAFAIVVFALQGYIAEHL